VSSIYNLLGVILLQPGYKRKEYTAWRESITLLRPGIVTSSSTAHSQIKSKHSKYIKLMNFATGDSIAFDRRLFDMFEKEAQ
jgi:hypothetical protein